MDTPCINWKRHLTNYGYGVLYYKDIALVASRVSYLLHKGKIGKGKVIDHLCRNRKCINPGHLEAVTNKESILRGNGAPAINARKTKCKKGHKLKNNCTIKKWRGRVCNTCKNK